MAVDCVSSDLLTRTFTESDKLQYDGFFLALLGVEKIPDQSSLRRFLQRLSPQAIRRLNHKGDLPTSTQLQLNRSGPLRGEGSQGRQLLEH